MICSLIPCSRPRAQTELLRTFQLMTLEQIPRTYHSQDCAVKCAAGHLSWNNEVKAPFHISKSESMQKSWEKFKVPARWHSTSAANSTACPSFLGQQCLIFTATMQITRSKRKWLLDQHWLCNFKCSKPWKMGMGMSASSFWANELSMTQKPVILQHMSAMWKKITLFPTHYN